MFTAFPVRPAAWRSSVCLQRTGGQPQFIFPIARAGAAVGVDGVFLETHPDPSKALSDAATQLPFELFEPLLMQIKKIDTVRRELAA